MRTSIVTAVLLALLAGCSSSGDGYEYVDDDPSPTPVSTVSQRPVTARELAGHWNGGDYGDMYIQLRGTEVRVVYGRDGGRMTGTLRGATFVGWWTENPTRKPPDDAGEVIFTFGRTGGGLVAQGQWRGGTSGEFDTDWTMSKVDDVVPAAARTAFADDAQFVRHP